MWPYLDQSRQGFALTQASAVGNALCAPFVSMPDSTMPVRDRLPSAVEATARHQGEGQPSATAANDDHHVYGLRDGARQLLRAIAGWAERHDLRRTLLAMDDHQLDDIGLTRADINAVVAGRHRRPRR